MVLELGTSRVPFFNIHRIEEIATHPVFSVGPCCVLCAELDEGTREQASAAVVVAVARKQASAAGVVAVTHEQASAAGVDAVTREQASAAGCLRSTWVLRGVG